MLASEWLVCLIVIQYPTAATKCDKAMLSNDAASKQMLNLTLTYSKFSFIMHIHQYTKVKREHDGTQNTVAIYFSMCSFRDVTRYEIIRCI